MKKRVLTVSVIVSAVLFAVSMQVGAQGLSFGVKGEANMTSFDLDSDAVYSGSKWGVGGSAGGFMKYDFGNWFALQADLMFRYRTADLESKATGSTSGFRSYHFELPLFAIFQLEVGNGKLYAGIGPYAGYGLSAKTGSTDMYKKDAAGSRPMRPFNYGAAAMLGYEFAKHWQVNASYLSEYGIGSIGDITSSRGHTLSIGLGYRF